MASGSKSGRIKPLDGDAFFTSAITAGSPVRCLASSAAAKSSAGGASLATRASSSAQRHWRLRWPRPQLSCVCENRVEYQPANSCVTDLNASRAFIAAPESIDFAASSMPCSEISSLVRDHQRRRRVEQHDVPARPLFALQHGQQRANVIHYAALTRRKVARRSPTSSPTSDGLQRVGSHFAVFELADLRLAERGDLVQPRHSVEDHRALRPRALRARSPSSRSRSGENTPITCRFAPAGFVIGPSMLKTVRIPDLFARPDGVLHRGMHRRREHEPQPRLVDALRRPVRRPD